jgi:hypothetical protein
MIVVRPFLGDDDTAIARRQHDVYWDALRVIVSGCNELTRFARTLLDDTSHPDWGEVGSYDHRTLQGAHDFLAAAWRFRIEMRQPELRLEGAREPLANQTPEEVWLEWLQREVQTWVEAPELVRYVQLILANQNEPKGYVAEDRLGLALLDRFSDVPWRSTFRVAYQAALDADLAKLSPPVSSAQSEESQAAIFTCECTQKRRPPCNQIPCKTTIVRAAREGWGPLE